VRSVAFARRSRNSIRGSDLRKYGVNYHLTRRLIAARVPAILNRKPCWHIREIAETAL
jgi:hypothetical protein